MVRSSNRTSVTSTSTFLGHLYWLLLFALLPTADNRFQPFYPNIDRFDRYAINRIFQIGSCSTRLKTATIGFVDSIVLEQTGFNKKLVTIHYHSCHVCIESIRWLYHTYKTCVYRRARVQNNRSREHVESLLAKYYHAWLFNVVVVEVIFDETDNQRVIQSTHDN